MRHAEFSLRSVNFDWNTKRLHASTISKFEIYSKKHSKIKKYIEFSKLKNIKHFNN